MYTLKNVKNFKGHEGESLSQGALHGPKGRVADWSDDFSGGMMRVHFISRVEEDQFAAWAMQTFLPTRKDYNDEPYDTAAMDRFTLLETAVCDMVSDFHERKVLEKHCKKGIVYFAKDAKAPEGKSLYVTKAAYTPENVAKVKANHGDVLIEICNEKLGLPFMDADLHAKSKENEHYKRLCRSATVFTLRAADGTINAMKSAARFNGDVTRAMLEAKYPNLVEIINERFV